MYAFQQPWLQGRAGLPCPVPTVKKSRLRGMPTVKPGECRKWRPFLLIPRSIFSVLQTPKSRWGGRGGGRRRDGTRHLSQIQLCSTHSFRPRPISVSLNPPQTFLFQNHLDLTNWTPPIPVYIVHFSYLKILFPLTNQQHNNQHLSIAGHVLGTLKVQLYVRPFKSPNSSR